MSFRAHIVRKNGEPEHGDRLPTLCGKTIKIHRLDPKYRPMCTRCVSTATRCFNEQSRVVDLMASTLETTERMVESFHQHYTNYIRERFSELEDMTKNGASR